MICKTLIKQINSIKEQKAPILAIRFENMDALQIVQFYFTQFTNKKLLPVIYYFIRVCFVFTITIRSLDSIIPFRNVGSDVHFEIKSLLYLNTIAALLVD